MAYRCIEELSGKAIQDIINSKPTVLIGSAISIFPPTNLSAGLNIVDTLFDFIFSDKNFTKHDLDRLRKEFNKIPFEAVMECYPNQSELPLIIQSIFNNDSYNEFHECFAKKLNEGVFHSIVTPNYDLAFDNILGLLGFDNIVYADSFDENTYIGKHLYFKIHGSAVGGMEDTLIYTLSQEKDLRDCKCKLLADTIKSRTLIIIGYSGRDFDICPVIKRLDNYNKIIWIDPNPGSTVYQDELIKAKPENEILLGDFYRFLQVFFNESINLDATQIIFSPQEFFTLSFTETLIWQLNILDRLACARYFKETLSSLEGRIPRADWLRYQSNYLGHTGEYKKAAYVHMTLLKTFSEDSAEYISTLLQVSGSWLGYLSFCRAYIYNKRAKKLAKQYFLHNASISLQVITSEIVFWSKFKQICPLFRRSVSKKLEKLTTTVDKWKITASLEERQLMQLNLERLGMKSEFSDFSGYKGYCSLGIAGMAIIAYRHKIQNNNWDNTEVKMADFKNCLDSAEFLGMSTELWKLCKIHLKENQLTMSERKNIWRKWKKNLKVTEYISPMFWYQRLVLYSSFFKYILFANAVVNLKGYLIGEYAGEDN